MYADRGEQVSGIRHALTNVRLLDADVEFVLSKGISTSSERHGMMYEAPWGYVHK